MSKSSGAAGAGGSFYCGWPGSSGQSRANIFMFSHIVIFWTKPEKPKAADELIAGMHQYLERIPGVVQLHAGRMVPSERPVVDKSYQVALYVVLPDKRTQDAYQVHPSHLEFVEKLVKPNCSKILVYDFEG